jgi:ATP synthase protein I
VDVDLSKELQAPTRPILKTQVEAAWRGRPIGAEAVNGVASPRWRLVPTRREQAKWDRAAKAATGGSVSHCNLVTDLLVNVGIF